MKPLCWCGGRATTELRGTPICTVCLAQVQDRSGDSAGDDTDGVDGTGGPVIWARPTNDEDWAVRFWDS